MSEVNELVAKVNFKFRGCGDFKRNVWASNQCVGYTNHFSHFRWTSFPKPRHPDAMLPAGEDVVPRARFDRRWLNQFGGIFEAGEVG